MASPTTVLRGFERCASRSMVWAASQRRSLSNSSRKVYIAGQGIVPVTRKQSFSLRIAGATAIRAALSEARIDPKSVGALYVGNMLGGMLSNQQHVGPLLATEAGLVGVEAATVEACCGSGGAALRWGYMAVQSGIHETVVVAGVEGMTHVGTEEVTKGLATASDWEKEGGQGETFVSLNGILMDLYLQKYPVDRESFLPFSMNAHQNATTSPHATLKKPITSSDYQSSKIVRGPIRILDASPVCDGAAAVILTSNPSSAGGGGGGARVRIAASAAASDHLAVRDRPDPLRLAAVETSFAQSLRAAGLSRGDVDIFELHDAYSVMACLCLEAAGFARRGEGTSLAAAGGISLAGEVPIATFGGLKARGHPVGATGVYQAAEMYLQLTGRAGANQVPSAEVAVVQNIGGAGSSVFAHVLVKE